MISNYLPNIKGLIIDMDGVLWRDTEPIGDLPAIFDRIRESGLKLILATNNSTRTIDEYLERFKGFGVTLETSQVITSGQGVGMYLNDQYPEGANVYVVGQPGLKKTLSSYSLNVVDEEVQDVQAVVASMDFSLTYDKIKHASLLIQAGSGFIGTNPDPTLPTAYGFIPGSGTVIGAIEIASGTKAKIIGKPQPTLYEMALERLGLKPEETLAIGDRLDTDIAGAQAAGIHTALVLTGASTFQEAQHFEPQPEIIIQDLQELIS